MHKVIDVVHELLGQPSYVRDFASIVRPMVELTRKGKKFLWTEACDRSFEQMKKALVSADVMDYPLNEGGDFILDVDASDIGIGGIIHQVQGEQEKVIAYASRSLNKAEKNYCITEKELLAVHFLLNITGNISSAGVSG